MNLLNDIELARQNTFFTFNTQYKDCYDLLNESLDLSHQICEYINMDDTYLRILGVIYTKGLVISKSMYSLIIDGYGQESGSLLRVLLETIELINYIREDESRINEVIEKRLPTAGKIAKIISGDFKELREYLNDNASHFNITYYSLSHIVDINAKKLKPIQKTENDTLVNNLNVLIVFIYFLCREIILAIYTKVKISDEIINRIDLIYAKILELRKKT